MFIKNKYYEWYFSLMEKAKTQINIGYSEKHHIIPKSLGGDNAQSNIIRLSARQHFIAHKLLVKMTEGLQKQKMYKALWIIKHSKGHALTSRQFEQLRFEYAKSVSLFWSGRKMSPSHYQNFLIAREAAKNRGVRYGGMHSEHHKAIMIESNRRRKGSKNKSQPGKNSGSKNARAKVWTLINESGETFISVSIRPWCIENNIIQNTLVSKSKKNEFYKGWKIIKISTQLEVGAE